MTVVRLNSGRLRYELARRGLHGKDLARIARISEATISYALRGRPVRSHTIRKMALALTRTPPLPEVDQIIGPEEE